MSDRLRMTIASDEPDGDGIVARVVEVPGAHSQGRTRREAHGAKKVAEGASHTRPHPPRHVRFGGLTGGVS